ncbi:MAG: YfiR family protein [Sedimentisphaerales bacterium]
MKIIVYSLMLLLLMFAVVVCIGDEQVQNREQQIKAAFLYNFVMFTEWPADKLAEPNTITIGLLGEHPFGNTFDPIKNKTVKNKQLNIKNFGMFRKSFPQDNAGKLEFANYIEQLRKCHVLFICDSEHENYKAIIDAVKGYGVLTVGETEDFLGFGGIITFIPGTEKPVFDINLDACEHEGLKISSKVLRLARKVIDYDTPDAVNKNK